MVRQTTGLRTLRSRHSGGVEDNSESLKMGFVGEQSGLVADLADEVSMPEKEDLSELERSIHEEANSQYYKFGNPLYPQELDWAITFSKYQFPWKEIAFGNFSAKECYIKYTGTVREARVFFKKILQSKEQHKKYILDNLDEPPRFLFESSESSPKEKSSDATTERYCICKGKIKSGYYVACEADEDCEHGGWLHPECTNDLRTLTQEAIDSLDQWYCESCVDRIRRENEEENYFQGNVSEDSESMESVKSDDLEDDDCELGLVDSDNENLDADPDAEESDDVSVDSDQNEHHQLQCKERTSSRRKRADQDSIDNDFSD